MRRSQRLGVWLLAAAACSSGPAVYPIRMLASENDSGFPSRLYRVFRTPEDLAKFSAGLKGKGSFPASLTGVNWQREMVLVAFGGESERGERMSITRISEMSGTLIVTVAKTRENAAHPFGDEPISTPESSSQPAVPTTPFVLVAVPKFDGQIRFLASGNR